MSSDWYRNESWNKSIEERFLNKLKKSRSQRDQYLIIQALTIASSYPEEGLKLVQLYFDTQKDAYEDVRAYLAQVSAYLALNKQEKVLTSYKAILRREEEFPKHITTTRVDLPYFVATNNISSEFEFVLSVLEKYKNELLFPLDRFKWHASFAIIKEDCISAKIALEAAQVTKSGLRYHQNIGLVGKEHDKVFEILERISA